MSQITDEVLFRINKNRGKTLFCPKCRRALKEVSDITVIEVEVAVALADGMGVKELAEARCVSVKTIETHRANIYRKLEFPSRGTVAKLTKWAIREGLLQP